MLQHAESDAAVAAAQAELAAVVDAAKAQDAPPSSTALLVGELLSTDEGDSGMAHRWLTAGSPQQC